MSHGVAAAQCASEQTVPTESCLPKSEAPVMWGSEFPALGSIQEHLAHLLVSGIFVRVGSWTKQWIHFLSTQNLFKGLLGSQEHLSPRKQMHAPGPLPG